MVTDAAGLIYLESSEKAELMLGDMKNSLSWLSYLNPIKQKNPKQTSNKPMTLLAVLLSDLPELLKLKGEEMSATAEYPGTSGHSLSSLIYGAKACP